MIRKYFSPIDVEQYFTDPKFKLSSDTDIDSINVKENTTSALDYKSLIKNYLISIRLFERNNASKAKCVFLATIFLVISVSFIASTVVMALFPSPNSSSGSIICNDIDTTGAKVINNNNVTDIKPNTHSKVMLCTSTIKK